ncbi:MULTISPECIES: methyltransferase domain-containing protein [Kitasatospora]|uniref:methyltransferase domain-containing protein n=1 Tax=Kitasatospora TaxID=2063 RepID=UPI000C702C9E|nr:methyltransferase domain-containing protein [Kitasatospora sp. GP30]MDH6140968.1 protein-L-isoaspartate O-methyltransferase [Kitasatospora sp. GP30]
MTSTVDQDAEELRKALAQQLIDFGHLADPAWIRAFEEVPRHLFVPHFYRQGPDGTQERVSGDDPVRAEEWLTAVYQNRPLVTHLIHGNAASSSSQPSVMAVMLEALDVREGMRVKEIGTGTGYNAGLLCHRLGDGNVVSVDVDAAVATAARERLANAGYRPTVITGDGAGSHQPDPARQFDRIIATCGLSRIPTAWLRELATGGSIVAPLGSGLAVVNHQGSGRFLASPAYFMPLRAAGESGVVRRPPLPEGETRPSAVPVEVIADEDFRFLVSIAVPNLGWQYGFGDDGKPASARLWSADGSIAEVRDDGGVLEGGPRQLWTELEIAYRIFTRHDRPARDRFGITIDQGSQRVWLDHPDSGPSWAL